MEPAATNAPVVSDNPAASRYELRVGTELAGFVEYKLRQQDTVISLVHTEVLPAFQEIGRAHV